MGNASVDGPKLAAPRWQKHYNNKADSIAKKSKDAVFVIPGEAGIHFRPSGIQMVTDGLDSGLHRSDGFLRVHQGLD
jgi:hypothetical protein